MAALQLMGGDSIAFDSALELCQHQHRRIVLATLATEQRALTLNDLTKAICKYNHQTPITEVSADVLTAIDVSLNHEHLPKLASAGIISYEPVREIVDPTEQFDQLLPILSTILEADPNLEPPLER